MRLRLGTWHWNSVENYTVSVLSNGVSYFWKRNSIFLTLTKIQTVKFLNMEPFLTVFISKQSNSSVKSVTSLLLVICLGIGTSESLSLIPSLLSLASGSRQPGNIPSTFLPPSRDYGYNCLCPGVWRPVCTLGNTGKVTTFDNVCVATCRAKRGGTHIHM